MKSFTILIFILTTRVTEAEPLTGWELTHYRNEALEMFMSQEVEFVKKFNEV